MPEALLYCMEASEPASTEVLCKYTTCLADWIVARENVNIFSFNVTVDQDTRVAYSESSHP